MRYLLIFILALTTLAVATERRPLPQVALADRAGAAVPAERIAQEGRWLLIYIQKDCRTCMTMLRQVQGEEEADLARVTIIFEDASTKDFDDLIKEMPRLADARLLSDKGGVFSKEMKLKTAPVAIGIDKNTVHWMFTSTRDSLESQRSILFSWIKEN